jgi:hypothetical protein
MNELRVCKTRLLVLVIIINLAMLIMPVQAVGKVDYKENGNVMYYLPEDVPDPSSIVLGGNWKVQVTNYDPEENTAKVNFELFYREENLIPEQEGGAPEGSVDQFRITLVEVYHVDLTPGQCGWDDSETCNVYGRFAVEKMAWLPEGSHPPKERQYSYIGDIVGYFFIAQPNYFELETWLDDWETPMWHLRGSPLKPLT